MTSSPAPLPGRLLDALVALGFAEPGRAVLGRPVDGGVSSEVWRVELASGPVCVKGALAELKVAGDWQVSTDRAGREAAWLRLAAGIDPRAVPGVLGYDEQRRILVLDWVDGAVWKAQLLAGDIDPGTAVALGERLARLHAGSIEAMERDQREWEAARPLFDALRITPYLRASAAAQPSAAAPLDAIARHLAGATVTLVHGDVSPKNVLVAPAGPVLIDAECASPGDPAFDVAFCLNHLILKAAVLPAHASALADAARHFAAAYRDGVSWEAGAEVERRAAWIQPALALARVDGLSPVEYLSPSGRTAVRAGALAGLAAAPVTVEALLEHWSDNWSDKEST